MRIITIGPNEAGQRLDKYLHKYMKEAPSSFLYKMMRKKNITLNGSRCEGSRILREDDELKLFLAEETLEKFGAGRMRTGSMNARTGSSAVWKSFTRTGISWRSTSLWGS